MTMTREMFSARQSGRAVLVAVLGTGFLLLGGCSSAKPEYTYPEQIGGTDQHDPLGNSTNSDEQVGSLLDDDGLVGKVFHRDKNDEEGKADEKATEEELARQAAERKRLAEKGDNEIGVNKFLWRASLETLSFMPLSSADPFGGVIITDWSVNPKSPQERLKVTVYVLSRELRADGVRVAIFRQLRTEDGTWVNQPAADKTRVEIENAILTRARQLHVAQLSED